MSEQTGGAGMNEVAANFEKIRWGVARNPDHDLGTDLWLAARDERLFDLGLIVGAQVKAGPSRFRRPKYDADRNVDGWWFRVNRPHADYWLSHAVPHLLVLHNLDTHTSYWVHITSKSVVSTGKGAKLLVPSSQTVSEDQRDALLAVAATLRPTLNWEGSAWTGAGSLLPRDLIRHALIVPRLVAPHPNTGELDISAAQYVALLVQARVREINMAAQMYPQVPSIDEAVASSEWSWRFAGALGRRVTTGEIDSLLNAAQQPPDPPSRAASAVAAATALVEDGRSDEAVEILSNAIALDEALPVDQAWLTVQLARLFADIGRVDEARASALRVQQICRTHSEDVSATAISGVAAALLFNASAWGQRSLEQVITNTDTAAAWWRTQTTASGLSALAEREFKSWARDTSITIGGGDEVNDQLFAASLTANLLGDHGTWCYLSELLGKQALLRHDRHSEVQSVRRGLETLRIAGDEEGLSLAVARVVADGPADAVTLVASEIDLAASTHTTGIANLALLKHGGDVLDVETADRVVTWLLATIRNPTEFVARTNPSYLVLPRLVETLARVVVSGSARVRRSVIEYLLTLPGPHEGILAQYWGKVLDALPEEDWDEDSALIIARRSDTVLGELRLQFREVASRFDADSRAAILKEALSGSLDALGRCGDVRRLPTDELSALILTLSEQVRSVMTSARGGSYGQGGHDAARILALLNSWHASGADWDPLLDFLRDPAVAGYQKGGALHLLTSLARELPDEIRTELVVIAREIQSQRPIVEPLLLGSSPADALGPATELSAVLGMQEEESLQLNLLTLLAGDAHHRRWAARVAGRLGGPQHHGMLAVLAQDSEPEVRAAVGAVLAHLAMTQDGTFDAAILWRLLDDPGTRVHYGIATVLGENVDRSEVVRAVLTGLRGNRSAYVRLTAARALGDVTTF
jgi:Domain of unknown function (DUF4365)